MAKRKKKKGCRTNDHQSRQAAEDLRLAGPMAVASNLQVIRKIFPDLSALG